MAKAKAKQSKDPKTSEIQWLPYVEEQAYPAAQSHLGLLFGKDRVDRFIAELRSAAVVRFQANDIFRTSGLSPHGVSHSHVDRERKRILKGEDPSPLLLVRDEPHGKVVIAEGYHRLCAVYSIDEDAWIPCKII